jgi:outer membrane protein assembly factor BamB
VIALDALTGRPSWEYRYPRNERPALPRYRDLCPPLADGGRIYAAPADADRLLCLDAFTGRLIWEREGVEVVHLLGVARGRLIATFGGQVRGIRGLNLRTGADSGTGGWTIHDDGGEFTFGRGLVTEEAIVWPTKHGLHFLDPSDGSPLRSPIRGSFGNLCYADGVLLVTTATEVWGYISEAKKLGDRRKAVEKEPGNPVAHANLAQSLIDAGDFAEAEQEAVKAGDAKDRLRWLLAERVIRTGDKAGAKRIYEELAKGKDSFAAAGAVRLAELCEEPDKKREAWRRVFVKRGVVRDENQVPFRTDNYAEMRFGNLLAMRGTGIPVHKFEMGADFVAAEPLIRTEKRLPNHVALLEVLESPRIGKLQTTSFDPIISELPRVALPSVADSRIQPIIWNPLYIGDWFLFDRRAIALLDSPFERSRAFVAPTQSTAHLNSQFVIEDDLVLAQLDSGHLIVWDYWKRTVRKFPCTTKRWSEPPVSVGENHFLIPDDNAVFLFDAKAGKELARYTIPGIESLTGELPRFHIHQGDPLLLINRNHGIELDRLQIKDLKRTWREPVFAGRELGDVTFDGERFFTSADGTLAARRWKDGTLAWDIPLPDAPAKWKLSVSPQGLLVHPAESIIQNPEREPFRELRQKGWNLDRLLRDVRRSYDVWTARELPVLLIDPADGRLIQRLTFPAAGPAAGLAVTPKGVIVVTGKGSWTLTNR